MNIVIVAGGLGTRFKELSCFPKILLPTKEKDSILLEQLEYFHYDDVTIIVNKKYYKMVLNYIEVNNIKNVKVVASTNTNGSGNTIASVYNELPKKNVLFFWSDIVFERNAFFRSEGFRKPTTDVVIYTSNDGKYRYNIDKNGKVSNVSEKYNGNIPGVFYIQDISKVIPEVREQETDLVDFIIESQQDEFVKSVVAKPVPANIIEYRSLEDYKEILGMNDYKKAFAKLNNQWLISGSINWEVDSYSNNIVNPKDQVKWAETRNYLFADALLCHYKDGYLKFYDSNAFCSTAKLLANCEDKTIPMQVLNNILNKQEMFVKEVEKDVYESEYNKLIDNAKNGLESVIDILSPSNDWINKLPNNMFDIINGWMNKTHMDRYHLSPIHGNLNPYTIAYNMITKEVKLIHHQDNGDFFGLMEIDRAAYYRMKVGIDDMMVDPLVWGESDLTKYDCFDIEKLNQIPTTYRVITLLYVMSQLKYLATDVMKTNIMFMWIKFEFANLNEILEK